MKELPILCTVSGGKTSAFLAIYLREKYPKRKILFCFANTGAEKSETLDFLKNFQIEFNIDLVWLEALVNPKKGQGTRYTIVDYDTASRNYGPFESVIKKYGLPSKLFRHCTRELKEKPIHVYAKEILSSEYLTAMGIRADEKHRLSRKKNYIYPLAEIGVDKEFIDNWWSRQSFNLKLMDHEGNCDFCFLKSKRKRVKLIKEGLDVSWWINVEKTNANQIQSMFDVRNGDTIEELVRLANLENTQTSLLDDIEFDCFCKN